MIGRELLVDNGSAIIENLGNNPRVPFFDLEKILVLLRNPMQLMAGFSPPVHCKCTQHNSISRKLKSTCACRKFSSDTLSLVLRETEFRSTSFRVGSVQKQGGLESNWNYWNNWNLMNIQIHYLRWNLFINIINRYKWFHETPSPTLDTGPGSWNGALVHNQACHTSQTLPERASHWQLLDSCSWWGTNQVWRSFTALTQYQYCLRDQVLWVASWLWFWSSHQMVLLCAGLYQFDFTSSTPAHRWCLPVGRCR